MAKKKEYKMPLAASWAVWRADHGLPPSLELSERGKCFDCGEVLHPGACGGWHCRMEYNYVEFCCRCAGHG